MDMDGHKDSVGTHPARIFMKFHLHPFYPCPIFTSITLQVLWCLKHGCVQLSVVLPAQGVHATFIVTYTYSVLTCF